MDEKEEILPCSYDFVFKNIFGSNKDVFISFINSIFEKTGERKVKDIAYQNTDMPKEHMEGRSNILDVRAELDDGTQCNVEVQVMEQSFFTDRTLFHWARLYYGQLQAGETFQNLRKTICINILDFKLFKQETQFFSHHIIVNEESLKKSFEKFGIYFFELPKLREKGYSAEASMLENWGIFLATQDKEILEKIAMQDPTIKQAYDKLKYLSSDPEMQHLYHMERLKQLEINSELRASKENGIAEGRVHGKLEEKKALAKKMKSKGYSLEDIASLTDLSLEEIKALQ